MNIAKSQDDSLWAVKATPEVCSILDEGYAIFEQSAEAGGFKATKKEYLEHLARLDKANNIRNGADGALPPELMKYGSTDFNELLGYTNGINKVFLRIIERAGGRELALNNESAQRESEHQERVDHLRSELAAATEKVNFLSKENEDLVRRNELIEKESQLCIQEREQHDEAIRFKDNSITELNKQIVDLVAKVSSFETISQSYQDVSGQLLEAQSRIRENERDHESELRQKDAEHRLAVAEAIQKERDAAQQKLIDYRDKIEAEYRQELKDLRAKLEASQKPEPKPRGRKPKSNESVAQDSNK
ncbi:hypothetical protein [Paenibacillus sp. NRS-1760]|uniref:hypothetical protein n=1 Tax=Paenibacillus sp. NRS-1760 TaxID=3233902 RepID=UPI003D29A33A